MFRFSGFARNSHTMNRTVIRTAGGNTFSLINNNSSMTYIGGFNLTDNISCISANNNTLLRTVRKGILPNVTTVRRWRGLW